MSRIVGAKVYDREGNSPDQELRKRKRIKRNEWRREESKYKLRSSEKIERKCKNTSREKGTFRELYHKILKSKHWKKR